MNEYVHLGQILSLQLFHIITAHIYLILRTATTPNFTGLPPVK